MEKYHCNICGKKHPVFHGAKSPLPAILRDIPEKDWSRRVLENEGFYLIDKALATLEGYVQVFHEDDPSKSFFNWHVWVSVSPREFLSKIAFIESEKEVRLQGRLESEIMFYEDAVGLEVELVFDLFRDFPLVEIVESSEIKNDQNTPITTERVGELMNRLHHRELFVAPIYFDTPFTIRLLEELNNCKIKYGQGRFIISLISPKEVLFQIIPNSFLEATKDDRKGYGVHVAFDLDDELSVEHFERIKELESADSWSYHVIDGVSTYQLDLEQDHKKLVEIASKLIEDVFEEKTGQIEIDSFEI
ncbi:MAG: DUF2199 domain-containing protein [Lewinella sp.]|uniref:DUF2199 domain-containing protein n=1 Tax=Lewinella sp. TaxID=2004506 RepID=UPI003D6BFA82